MTKQSFEIIMMSLRQWELKIHLCLTLVLKSSSWILFSVYLRCDYLSDFCSSSGIIGLLPSVHSDLLWSKCNRSHKVQDETSHRLCCLDQWTLTFSLPRYRNSFPLEPRFPNPYLDSCLTTSFAATYFYCYFTVFSCYLSSQSISYLGSPQIIPPAYHFKIN